MSSKHILDNKKQYFALLGSFLEEKIDGEILRSEFYKQRHKDLDDDLEETKILGEKEYSGEISWEEFKKRLVEEYNYPRFHHPFVVLVDEVYSELKRFCQPSDMEAFDPSEDIDEEELRNRVAKLLAEYRKKEPYESAFNPK
jgi:hypothetical protein